MKVILSGIAVSILLAVAAAAVLRADQRYAYQSFATEGARVTPGENLVGEDWSGLAKPHTVENAKPGGHPGG